MPGLTRLRQRDGISCGPAVAVVAGALIEPTGASGATESPSAQDDLIGERFAQEQDRVHRLVNRVWPRRLGMTPAGMARALCTHRPYRWRIFRGRHDTLSDVRQAVAQGCPVAMLVGSDFPLFIPRHWVLLIDGDSAGFDCYEPSSGEVRRCGVEAVRESRLTGVGFPRPFAFVLPTEIP